MEVGVPAAVPGNVADIGEALAFLQTTPLSQASDGVGSEMSVQREERSAVGRLVAQDHDSAVIEIRRPYANVFHRGIERCEHRSSLGHEDVHSQMNGSPVADHGVAATKSWLRVDQARFTIVAQPGRVILVESAMPCAGCRRAGRIERSIEPRGLFARDGERIPRRRAALNRERSHRGAGEVAADDRREGTASTVEPAHDRVRTVGHGQGAGGAQPRTDHGRIDPVALEKIPRRLLRYHHVRVAGILDRHERRVDHAHRETHAQQWPDDVDFGRREWVGGVVAGHQAARGGARVCIAEHDVGAGDRQLAHSRRGAHVAEIDYPRNARPLEQRAAHEHVVIVDVVVDRCGGKCIESRANGVEFVDDLIHYRALRRFQDSAIAPADPECFGELPLEAPVQERVLEVGECTVHGADGATDTTSEVGSPRPPVGAGGARQLLRQPHDARIAIGVRHRRVRVAASRGHDFRHRNAARSVRYFLLRGNVLERAALHVDERRVAAAAHDLQDVSVAVGREEIQVELAIQLTERSVDAPELAQHLAPMSVRVRSLRRGVVRRGSIHRGSHRGDGSCAGQCYMMVAGAEPSTERPMAIIPITIQASAITTPASRMTSSCRSELARGASMAAPLAATAASTIITMCPVTAG